MNTIVFDEVDEVVYVMSSTFLYPRNAIGSNLLVIAEAVPIYQDTIRHDTTFGTVRHVNQYLLPQL